MNKIIEIGKRIKQQREEMGKTQEELGKVLWLNKSTIQRYESGKITRIKIPIIHAIAKELDVDPNWLMGDSEDKGHFIERYDKYNEWDNIVNKEFSSTIFLDYSTLEMRKEFCRRQYNSPDECYIVELILEGLDDLNINGMKKVDERIRELKYIPEYTASDIEDDE